MPMAFSIHLAKEDVPGDYEDKAVQGLVGTCWESTCNYYCDTARQHENSEERIVIGLVGKQDAFS